MDTIEAETEPQDALALLREEQVEKVHEFIKDRITSLTADDLERLVAALLRPRILAEVKHRKREAMGSQQIRSFLGALRSTDRGLLISTGGYCQREALPDQDPRERILTLAPVHALAAGFAIYPELAAGPFFFRNANAVPLEDQRRWVVAGPGRLPELVADRAPVGIHVGHAPGLDASLEGLAESLGFRPVPAGRGTLWVRR